MKGSKEAIIQFSTLITIISLVWVFTGPFLESINNIFLQAFFILMFGIGGLGLYLPIGHSIKKFHDTYK